MADKPTRRGTNLTQADRERGGRESARKQVRDERGQFAGSRDKKTPKNHNNQEGMHGQGQRRDPSPVHAHGHGHGSSSAGQHFDRGDRGDGDRGGAASQP